MSSSPSGVPRVAHASPASPSRSARGFTLIELIIVCALLGILVLAVYPSARYVQVRAKEAELQSALRLLRSAIDEHHRWTEVGLIEIQLGTDGYPSELEDLVKGLPVVGQVDKKIRFLRRIPVDPMTGKAEWGLRSYQDEPDSTSWGGEDVYDVYSLSAGVALDGSKYADW